jgi:hypothetical protein
VNTFCRAPTRGNCRLDDNEEATEKEGNLPKRRTGPRKMPFEVHKYS